MQIDTDIDRDERTEAAHNFKSPGPFKSTNASKNAFVVLRCLMEAGPQEGREGAIVARRQRQAVKIFYGIFTCRKMLQKWVFMTFDCM